MKQALWEVIFLGMIVASVLTADAAVIDDLKNKINERNNAIVALEKEIGAYQDEIEKVGKESHTLQSTVKSIELEQKKLATSIKLTEKQIESVTLAIAELAAGIEEKSQKIDLNSEALNRALRSLEQLEDTTLIETLLANDTLGAFWGSIDSLKRFDQSVKTSLLTIKTVKADMETRKAKTEVKQRELGALRAKLADQKQILEFNRHEKRALLSATKNKESEYKKLLAQKVARRDAFAEELLQFESQLQFEIDPLSLPKTGSGVLKWPLDSVKITQYFGKTAFALAGAYNGHGHNGIDLRAEIGTPVRSALGGVVKGVGNTDTVCPGASYGKWVLIEHGDGLSTLYAHLSLIKVLDGQNVATGETIGYSGETGYATGPHLHLTVYATQGVRTMNRKSSVCKGSYLMPVADLKAYLNPLSYL